MNAIGPVCSERLDFIWLELTAACNLECQHCYSDSGPQLPIDTALGTDDWKRVLDDAAVTGCRRVQFIGGEPTVHPGLAQLMAHARSRGFEEVSVYTNGTHFTPALKQAFVDHDVSLAFSVYGSTATVHDTVTRRDGSFAKTCESIRWALARGLAVRAGVIVMDANRHDHRAAEAMLRAMGVVKIDVDRSRGIGRGAGNRPILSPLNELCGRCGGEKLCVSHSGEIYPCVFARFAPLGSILEGGLAAAFAGQSRARFKDALVGALGARTRCSPEEPVPPCNPEKDPGPCSPEKDPGDCNPEKDPGPCSPDKPSRYEASDAVSRLARQSRT